MRTGTELATITGADEIGGDPACNWIQVTSPISQGSSGGPLVNSRGQVIGVNSAMIASRGAQNLNLAIASDSVQAAVVNQHALKSFQELPTTLAENAADTPQSSFTKQLARDLLSMTSDGGQRWGFGDPSIFKIAFQRPRGWTLADHQVHEQRRGDYVVSCSVWTSDKDNVVLEAADVPLALAKAMRDTVAIFPNAVVSSQTSFLFRGMPCSEITYVWPFTAGNEEQLTVQRGLIKHGQIIYVQLRVRGPKADDVFVHQCFRKAKPLFDEIFSSVRVMPE